MNGRPALSILMAKKEGPRGAFAAGSKTPPDPKTARGGRSAPTGCVRPFGAAAVMPQHVLHLVLQVELLLLQRYFFELFGFREIRAGRQVVDAFVEIVVFGGELAELVVALQQLSLQLFEVRRHFRLLG